MTYTIKTSHFSFPDHPTILNSCAQAIPWQIQHKINHDCVNTIKDTFITAVLVLQIPWAQLNISKPLQFHVYGTFLLILLH